MVYFVSKIVKKNFAISPFGGMTKKYTITKVKLTYNECNFVG